MEPELLADAEDVTFGGALGYREPRPDLFVGQPIGDERGHGDFAGAQRSGGLPSQSERGGLGNGEPPSLRAQCTRARSESSLKLREPSAVRQ